MRPAGKGALESLYFDYPRFAARRVPELDAVAPRHPVLIVGAGPIGMTAALVLARYGIKSVLIERKDTFNDGSRAICIARPSMHILERVGAVAPFVEKALGWRFGRSYYRGEQIFRLEMPQPSGEKYLPMYNLGTTATGHAGRNTRTGASGCRSGRTASQSRDRGYPHGSRLSDRTPRL